MQQTGPTKERSKIGGRGNREKGRGERPWRRKGGEGLQEAATTPTRTQRHGERKAEVANIAKDESGREFAAEETKNGPEWNGKGRNAAAAR